MAIFIIKEKEISEVTFKVEANSLCEAYGKIDEWVRKAPTCSNNWDQYRDVMNASCRDSREHIRIYDNEDDYNMHYCGGYDFEIKGEKDVLEEPLYFIEFKDAAGASWTYLGVNSEELGQLITRFSKNWIIKRRTLPSAYLIDKRSEAVKKYKNGNEMLLFSCYEIERRKVK